MLYCIIKVLFIYLFIVFLKAANIDNLLLLLIFPQPSVSLRDLGLSEVRVSQLDDLVSRLLPVPSPEEPPTVSTIWRTSHVSADSFFQNKHGEQRNKVFFELSF